jgi:hypothetical protein
MSVVVDSFQTPVQNFKKIPGGKRQIKENKNISNISYIKVVVYRVRRNQNRIEKWQKHKEAKLELGGITQEVESLPSNCESLSSNVNTPTPPKKNSS